MSKIIAPNGAVNSYLEDKEKRCLDKINAIFTEENCFIFPVIQYSATATGMIPINYGFNIVANERNQKVRAN